MHGYENILTFKRILEASEVMDALQEAFFSLKMPDEETNKKSALASLRMKLAQLYLSSTAYHMYQGQDLHGALRVTLNDELKLFSDQFPETDTSHP